MEARSVEEIPVGDEWQYEPKWDGFRCIAFRDGKDIYLQSKAGQPLARYFPDIVAALGQFAGGPLEADCRHERVWVVDTATRRVVRRACAQCKAEAVDGPAARRVS